MIPHNTRFRLTLFGLLLLLLLKGSNANDHNSTTAIPNNSSSEFKQDSTTTPVTTTTRITETTTTTTTTPKITCDCNNNGICDDSRLPYCKCNDGYSGDNCEFKKCELADIETNQCIHGVCLKGITTNKTMCQCNPGYGGGLCEKPLCLDYCYNDGKCIIVSNSTLSCECQQRYLGDRCQFDTCTNKNTCSADCFLNSNCECLCKQECDKAYCNKNNGTCVNNNGKLECKCNVGYSGPICMVDECRGYCFNGGECVKKDTFYCICPSNYTGPRCARQVNQTESIKKSEKNTMRSIIYGFTIALFFCLMSIGVYYAIQKDYFIRLYDTARSCFRTESSRTQLSFFRAHNNFSFNKLEDEQGIVQNETMLM